jgi:hypothetical protein
VLRQEIQKQGVVNYQTMDELAGQIADFVIDYSDKQEAKNFLKAT